MADIPVNADLSFGGVGKIKGLAAASANGEAVRFEQLAGYQLTSEKGVANGYAGLDGTGKVPTAQLPSSVVGGLVYGGAWNANTNSPALASSTNPSPGTTPYYIVSTNGTTTLDGISEWKSGDWVVFNGTAWEKIDNTDQVASVAGRTGAVTLGVADVSGALAAASNLGDVANATTARSNLGLGDMAVQSAGSVSITGGSITGITDLTVADGGTGASTSANARKNLGAVGQYTQLFGDGAATSFTIAQATHGLAVNSRIGVLVQDASTGAEIVWAASVSHTTGDVTLSGNVAPASSSRRLTLFGVPA